MNEEGVNKHIYECTGRAVSGPSICSCNFCTCKSVIIPNTCIRKDLSNRIITWTKKGSDKNKSNKL